MGKLKFLNGEVSPPILTVAHLTNSHKRWSKNTFVDPEDNEPFELSDLLPAEKGHIYLCHKRREGDYLIHTPFRVMDQETSWVGKFKSYRSTKKILKTHKNMNTAIKTPRSCIQDFLLSYTDFKKFARVARDKGWVLKKYSVGHKKMIEEIKYYVDLYSDMCISLSQVRREMLNIETSEQLNSVLGTLEHIENQVEEILSSRRKLVTTMDDLREEADRQADLAEVEISFHPLQAAYEALPEVNIQHLYDTSRQQLLINQVDTEATQQPLSIGSLEFEIKKLAQYYPALQKLSIEGSSVHLTLSGVTIKLDEASTSIEGDLAALRPYAQKPVTDNQRLGRSSRLTNILVE